jgi:hypothetical protein
LPSVNPLERAREGATSAWTRSKDGTRRTATWIRDGVAENAGKLREAASRDSDKAADAGAAKAKTPESAGGAGLWERIGGASAWQRASSDRRVAIAWVAGGLLFVAWIAWTIYVWNQNGSAAGIGVLISWPAVLAALALVAAPFVGAGVLVRRHQLATAGGPDPEAAAGSQDDSGDEESDQSEEPEDSDEEQEEGEAEESENEESDAEDEDSEDEGAAAA